MVAIEAITSGIAYAVLAALAGVLVTAGFLLPTDGPGELRKSLLLWAVTLLLVFLVIASLSLLIQGAKLRGGALPSLEILVRYLTMTQSGKIWLLREIYGVALAAITLWLAKRHAPVKNIRFLALLALPLLASRSLTSHAAAVRENTVIAVAADAIHLIATGLWGGGLLTVSWVLYQGTKDPTLPLSWAAETVRRLSLLALASVVVLFITGIYQSWIQVGSLKILFATDYGRVLVLKLTLFLGMIGLGALNLLSTKPRLLRATRENKELTSVAKKALARIGAESSFALLVFFVTGLLTVLPPGVHAVHQSARLNVPPAASSDSPAATRLQPAEGASVKILSPAPGQVFATDRVPLRFQLTKGKRGNHVHAYIDGELIGMFQSKQGTLNGIKPGGHTLELRVVADDHQTELDAQDRVEFVVKQ
jgi:putative copper export protein